MAKAKKLVTPIEDGTISDRTQRPPLFLESHSAKETQQIGRALGALASPGDVFLLVGELGSGKTCLAQGIAWGVGVKEYVRSPTFVLASRYEGRMVMHHIDLYRLETVGELLDLGLEEYFHGPGCCVVEWADKGQLTAPPEHVLVQMEFLSEKERRVTIEGKGARHNRFTERLVPLLRSHRIEVAS